jgi:SAM-dependent methyltransferase
MDNQTLYRTVAFDEWAEKEGLLDEECFLLSRYLQKGGRTLDAGTGGGRILFALRQNGFDDLYGFDYVPELVYRAREKDRQNTIHFDVQNAIALDYEDGFFQHILYLQQILSMFDDHQHRLQAAQEAYRVLCAGGTALFSFLSFEIRREGPFSRYYLPYLSILRWSRGSCRTIQCTPWLKYGGKVNMSAVWDSGPYVYWFRLEEAGQLLESVGFRVIAAGSGHQLLRGEVYESLRVLQREPLDGMLYIVATK